MTDRLVVPRSWVTGYYLAIFRLTSGPQAGDTGFAPFIVQATVGDRSQILVVVPTNTWQAYNTWGGESVYTSPQAVKVSFNRPYAHRLLFLWEYPLLRFLERNGYDLSYATDDDVARDPSILLHHRLDIAAGHGEYWTNGERDGWDAARAAGVNFAFMGANDGYWQVRYEDNYRTMVSYKSNADPERDPALKTVQFRALKPPRPECELLGEQSGPTEGEDGEYFGYQVTPAGAQDPWMKGTGLRAGSTLNGIVGFEFDSVVPTCHVPRLTVLFHWRGVLQSADAVRYRACSGSEVFDAGSLFFSWGLDAFRDPQYAPPIWPPPPVAIPALGRFMRNAIADMLRRHRRLSARECQGDVARAASAARPQLFGVPGSPFRAGAGPDAVAFSPDGKLVAAADATDGTMSVYSVTPTGVLSPVRGSSSFPGADPSSIAFSPNGRLLVTANYIGNTVSVFSVAADGNLTAVRARRFPPAATRARSRSARTANCSRPPTARTTPCRCCRSRLMDG